MKVKKKYNKVIQSKIAKLANDDSFYIQQKIDDLYNGKGGGKLIFKNKSFRVKTRLIIPKKVQVIFDSCYFYDNTDARNIWPL